MVLNETPCVYCGERHVIGASYSCGGKMGEIGVHDILKRKGGWTGTEPPTSIEELVQRMSGIRLDIGCGKAKQPGFVGMDVRDLPGVDIIHDVNDIPWPLPDECALVAMCSHLVEHIPPVQIARTGTRFPFVEFMNEVWRVLKPDGRFAISAPHGSSQGFLQDPTHCNALNEATYAYFDPAHPSNLYSIYTPKPWKIERLNWNPTANVEVVLVKRREGDDGTEGTEVQELRGAAAELA